MPKIRILFNAWADRDNTNAQSLNARDIAIRLDPHRFASAFFSLGEPKPELSHQPHIKIIKIPRRLGSFVMAAQMAWGTFDLIYYPPIRRLRKLFNLFQIVGRKKPTVCPVEASAQQILAIDPASRQEILHILGASGARYAIGSNIAKTMAENFGLPMKVVPLGVDTQAFSFNDRRNHSLPVKVLTLATIQPRKQTHVILDLAQHIHPDRAEFHIVGNILGDPAYGAMLLKRQADQALTNVYFHDKVWHGDLPGLLQNFDIFVLPSRLEGVPRITLEAAATGMPCIIFDDYHSPSVIDGVTGFQVQTVDQMVERVKLLIGDKYLRWEMGRQATKHVQQYDWDIIVKLLEAYFQDIVQSNSLNKFKATTKDADAG
jgi:glycosyltransferase involved in cell wall biosynthesis